MVKDNHLMTIVLCLILDSRQNFKTVYQRRTELYCALFWIQGKTHTVRIPSTG